VYHALFSRKITASIPVKDVRISRSVWKVVNRSWSPWLVAIGDVCANTAWSSRQIPDALIETDLWNLWRPSDMAFKFGEIEVYGKQTFLPDVGRASRSRNVIGAIEERHMLRRGSRNDSRLSYQWEVVKEGCKTTDLFTKSLSASFEKYIIYRAPLKTSTDDQKRECICRAEAVAATSESESRCSWGMLYVKYEPGRTYHDSFTTPVSHIACVMWWLGRVLIDFSSPQ
jgi:hypothetical protein